jgi:hypothetical protein
MRCRAFIQSSGLNAILRLDAYLRTGLALQRNPGARTVALVLVQMLVLALLLFRTPSACAHPTTLSSCLAHAGLLSLALAHVRTFALALALALARAITLAHVAPALTGTTALLRHRHTAAQRSHQNRNQQNLLMHIPSLF